jgi:quinone-modifying oxidoreductase, subunit QmoB
MIKDIQSDVLVLGDGVSARQIAVDLAGQGLSVQLVGAGDAAAMPTDNGCPTAGVTPLSGCRLMACSGQAGAFQLRFEQAGRLFSIRAAGIVVAAAPNHRPAFGAYGLAASERVLTASELARMLDSGTTPDAMAGGKSRVAFLNGWHHETHPVVAARMLQLCLRTQQGGADTFFLSGNLKVAVEGSEACCQAAKAAGAVFLKFTDRFPELEAMDEGRVRITYWDETTRMLFTLAADCVIVDEHIAPDPVLIQWADILRLERDAFGFAQSENVHRLGNETNRRGIFVADGARAILSSGEQRADAGHVVLKVTQFLSGNDRAPLPVVEIDQGRCARCLTCYRLCPHAAIDIDPRMTVIPEACQCCGICAAGCPNRAIRVEDARLATALLDFTRPGADKAPDNPFVPRIVAFCCDRSAVAARELALGMGHRLPPGLVFVEGLCGGTFSIQHLLSAFDDGVDGVMVLTCHPGNCHSEQGTLNAQTRCAQAAKALAAAGVDGARIHFSTLAANMSSAFVQRAAEFERQIAALGPLLGS